MNGEIAQLIGLAAHGTAWLREPTGSPPRLERENSTFQFVRSVTFSEGPRALALFRAVEFAEVAGWLARLRETGITALNLVVSETTGAWSLLATRGGAGRADAWHATWTVGDSDAPDSRIWDVTYRRRRVLDERLDKTTIAAAERALRDAAARAEQFALDHELDPWAETFAAALEMLEDEQPSPAYHPDLMPATFPQESRRLLAASSQAWVFGGMGSWNDLGFEDERDDETYRDISGQLYAAVVTGLVVAVNAGQ